MTMTDLERLASLVPATCVRQAVPMSGLTTLRLGGPADLVL